VHHGQDQPAATAQRTADEPALRRTDLDAGEIEGGQEDLLVAA